jgi:pimeloyl-ACP methyl ester carboxylesterase
MIALKLAVLHPERVTALALGGMGWMRDGAELSKIWELLPAPDMGRVPVECIRSVGELTVSEDELRAVRVPVEVVVGQQDPWTVSTWPLFRRPGPTGRSSESPAQTIARAS